MKVKRTLTALLALMWSFAAQADKALISGAIRVGAYDVEVQNASRTNWVDGELVITYLNTDTSVVKSFTLPQATTGRLLAVGGGGAGGQDQKQKYDASYGLPGGGGAGGLVIKDAQEFDAKTYKVSVGAGGAAVARTLTTINKVNTWVPASYGPGANGGDSTVKQGTTAIVTAKGGGGGGRRSVGNAGGSGGGGSASYASSKVQAKNGGSGTSEQGYAGGKGSHAKFGAGGGGAGGAGGPTTAATVDGSGAGGAGKKCDITGEMLEYARGGAGGIPRVYSHYWDDNQGVRHYASISTDSSGKITSITYAVKGDQLGDNKYFWVEASDGKPGRDGFGDGGGGSGHYSSNPTFAGRGGNGAVIVRIPPYRTSVEDALKAAFANRPVTVSDRTVTLTGDVAGPIDIPDNLGAVTIKLNGHVIKGADGADGDDITPGDNGQPALKIVPHEYDCESGVTALSVTGTGSLKGGNGGKGYPGGAGAVAVSADGFAVNVAGGISVTAGTAGESYVQHPHKWAYTIKDNKIVAYCVAEDGEPCSYRDQSRGPFVAVSAADAAYTAMRYDELTSVNGITPVTGIVVAPETYVGRDGTDYPESSTPPREQGAYTVSMQLGDLRITSDFTITEPKPSQGSVYQAWKTAERKGRDVQIALSATFDGSKAINDGNVLFLGSRCSAHSMAGGTVESSVNAMTRYASVRWYAYGSSDPANNLVNQWTKKGEKVAADTVALIGANHFVHKEMMDDLYAELVEKKNRDDGYDLIILEFDGDLLCREGFAPYQLNYRLPEGWTDEKAARLRAAMSRYYAEDRVVWIVPDVNQEKSDAGYTGEYPWTSNPEFIWQRAFLNASETEGYKCPLQKNYEDADELVDYLQEVLVGHFFSNAIIEDTLAEGLTIKKVTPQMRSDGGIWRNFDGGPSHYTIPEPRSGTTVTADVERVERQVTVTFDMKAEQAWACEHDQVIGDDFRVVIDAELDGFFSVGEGEWQETNEGPATFTFTESNLDEDEEDFTITIEKDSPTIQNVKLTPDYAAEDVVRIYDGKGMNIVVKPIAPTPEDAIIRYSLDEHGTYTDNLALTNVCEKTKVWFEITDKKGDFTMVTNFATVTVLPRVVVEQAEDAEKPHDGMPLTQPAHSNVLSRAIAEAEQMYPGQGASAAGFVEGEGFASVPMTADSQQIEVGSHANTIDRAAVTVNEKTDKNNYVFIYLPGTLTVTPPLPMGIAAFPTEKFYDAEPTNVAWVVTNAQGGVVSDATVFLRERGTGPWIPAADFVPYVDATNVTVEVKAEKAGFDDCFAEATVDIWPRPVTLIAASDSKTYDGLPLTNWAFEVKSDTTTPGYGFVKEEGVASVTMTPESTITDPGSVPNEIASVAAKPNTRIERNYTVTTEPGTLAVIAAAMGIAAFPTEKFYDAEPTNVTWVVTNAQGGVVSDATVFLRERGTGPWIPAADFVPYVDATNVTVEVKAEKAGFDDCFAEATVDIWPRPVTLIAASDSKTYDGLPLTNWAFEVKSDTTTPGYGFVKEEGVASVTMTPESTITNPGSADNEIETTVAKEGTKLDRNYVVSTEPGILTVTPAAFTASATPYDGFYDGQEHTIAVEVQKPEGAGEATITYAYAEGGTYLPLEDFEQLKDVTAAGPVTVYAKVEVEGYSTVVVNATVNIKPRIVVEQAESASKIFDGTPLVQPSHHEETDVEAEKSKEKWSMEAVLANSTGFVAGEGFADVPMTAGSTITEPGEEDNVIDVAAVTLLEGTKPGNYVFFYLPGELAVIQRQEEVRRDPEVEIPEESKQAVEESDKKIEEALDEMAKADQEATEKPYVKYQLTVTPTNSLSEATRTTPEKAAEDAKEQVELAESETGSKIDKVDFVDVVLERTYSKEEAEATAAGNYDKDKWEPLDKAEEHGNRLFEVVVPVEVPEGMELIGVTRSCDNKGTELLKPKDPNDPNAEGFVYDPETKTVTLYARDFCVFGFHMKEKEKPTPTTGGGCKDPVEPVYVPPAAVYEWKFQGRTGVGVLVRKNWTSGGGCVDTASGSNVEVIRVPGSMAIQAYTYICDDECMLFGSQLTHPTKFEYYAAKPFKSMAYRMVGNDPTDGVQPGTHIQIAHVIGKSHNQYELGGVARFAFGGSGYAQDPQQVFELTFAGFGTYDARNGRISSVSGRYAGALQPPRYNKYVRGVGCPAADYWDCATLNYAGAAGTRTAAYGTWSVRYNSAASKRLESNSAYWVK